jgi:voltage-gated potassium channel
VFVALLVYANRAGYTDAEEDGVSLLDAFYYASVSVTTTATATSGRQRHRPLISILLVTPCRVLFLILLVGTTLELLTERTREGLEQRRWRKGLREPTRHLRVGPRGTRPAHARRRGIGTERIIVIDESPTAREAASALGAAVVAGDARAATCSSSPRSPPRRRSSSRPTATTPPSSSPSPRGGSRRATIVGAVREEENAALLRQSGADSVYRLLGAAGRLLGLATESPRVGRRAEDLLTVGQGLDLASGSSSPTRPPARRARHPRAVVAVVRDGHSRRFADSARRRAGGGRLHRVPAQRTAEHVKPGTDERAVPAAVCC